MIAFSKYVDIVSAVGGAAQAVGRELILRLMTENPLIPTETVVEFDTADEVATYFGTTSVEFLQAQFYFGHISKLATTPTKISFARYSLSNTAPLIIGATNNGFAVSDFDSITDATFRITLGTNTEDILINFVTAAPASLADVATEIETAVQAANVLPVWTGAVCIYNATDARFELTGGDFGDLAVAAVPTGAGTNLLPIMGWEPPSARFSNGIVAETITGFLQAQNQLTNNFGSYAFISVLTDSEILESAIWNDGENVKFMYLHRVLAADAQTSFDALNTYSGTALTLYDAALTTDYPWIFPGAILAATPYARRNSVQNYMFQQASLVPTVVDSTLSNFYDDIRVNYYGQTQQAGELLAFYQRGFLMGLAVDPIDMGVYANEAFLKDAIGVSIINLLLALSAVPANESGVTQVLSAVQDPIEGALFSGIISVGKTLNATQIAFVSSVTGDPVAYVQIENSGYWITAVINEPSPSEFVVQYTLLYSKNDVIRKVEGSHLLI